MKTKILITGMLLVALLSCRKEEIREVCLKNAESGTVSCPPKPDDLGDGWQVETLCAVGMDPAPILDLVHMIDNLGDHHYEGLLIVKDNYLVYEKYWPGYEFNWDNTSILGPRVNYGPRTRHYLASESKSVTSLVFGIAMDQGLISSVDNKIEPYYSSDYPGLLTGQKKEITIKQLLTMSSGLAWDESTPATSDAYYLFRVSDPIRYILSLALQHPPGTFFHYNSGGTNILGDLVHRTSGINLREFARTNLFGPLQITNWEWKAIRNDHYFASGGLFMTPRDLIKLGQLCLNKGRWGDRQIVSEAWIRESTAARIAPAEMPIGDKYGYQWWMKDFAVDDEIYRSYFAVGWGEQYMYVFKRENLIILFTGSYYYEGPEVPIHYLVNDFILPAVTANCSPVPDTGQ